MSTSPKDKEIKVSGNKGGNVNGQGKFYKSIIKMSPNKPTTQHGGGNGYIDKNGKHHSSIIIINKPTTLRESMREEIIRSFRAVWKDAQLPNGKTRQKDILEHMLSEIDLVKAEFASHSTELVRKIEDVRYKIYNEPMDICENSQEFKNMVVEELEGLKSFINQEINKQ